MTSLFTKAGLLAAALALGIGSAQAAPPAQKAKAQHAAMGAAHSAGGVVKSMSDNSLVIVRSGKKAEEMTFALDSTTQRKGTVAVGSAVSVTYHDAGTSHVATAISVQPAKAGTPKSK